MSELLFAPGRGRTPLARSTDGGLTASIVRDIDNANWLVAFHPTASDVVVAGDARSTDGGLTWQPFSDLAASGAEVVAVTEDGETLWAVDVARQARNVWRSTDAGESFQPVVAGLGWTLARGDLRPSFAAHPTDPDVFFSIDADGDLAAHDVGAREWTTLAAIGVADPVPSYTFVRDIAVDPNDPDVIYVGLSEPGIEQVLRTRDGGQTWEPLSANLPRVGKRSLRVHPLTGDLFLGSPVGSWIHPPPGTYEPAAPSFTESAAVLNPSSLRAARHLGSDPQC